MTQRNVPSVNHYGTPRLGKQLLLMLDDHRVRLAQVAVPIMPVFEAVPEAAVAIKVRYDAKPVASLADPRAILFAPTQTPLVNRHKRR